MKAGGQQAGKGSKSTKAAETYRKKPLTLFWLRSCRSLKPRWSGDGNRMCVIAGTWLRWPLCHGEQRQKGRGRKPGTNISPSTNEHLHLNFCFPECVNVWMRSSIWQLSGVESPRVILVMVPDWSHTWASKLTEICCSRDRVLGIRLHVKTRKCKNVAKIKLSTPRVTLQPSMSLQGFTRERALVSVSRFKEVGVCVAAFVLLLTHRGTYGSWYKSLEAAPMSSYSFQRGRPGNTHSSWRKEDTLESSLFNLQFHF